MNNRVPLAVSASAVMCAAILSDWAWLVVDGSTVPAGIGSNLEPVTKFQGLVIGPLLFIGLPIALFLLVPKIEPRREHLWSSAKAYGAIWVTVVLGGLVAHTAFVVRAANWNLDLSENLFELVFPLLLIVAGNYLSKLRSNYFIGIRTPWTLSSEIAWRKTHRVGGRVLMLLGLALIPLAFYLHAGTNLWVTGAALTGVALVLFVDSYFAWRSDPNSHLRSERSSAGNTNDRRRSRERSRHCGRRNPSLRPRRSLGSGAVWSPRALGSRSWRPQACMVPYAVQSMITVRPDAAAAQPLKTLVHELAHGLLHGDDVV